MRLTLRTLIAYLDDILDPAQTREIGQKISESEVAQQLVNRVKEVLRRRRLTAPAVKSDDANMDANRIAEYLDNTLSPADVAEVEKICLESDMHLAEAAACHQILTLVLGEPVDIVPESREKMYSLGPKAVTQEASVAASVTSESRIAPATRESTTASGKVALSAKTFPKPSPESSVPLELPRKSFVKRAVPLITILLLVGTFVGLVLTDPSFEWLFESGSSSEQIVAENVPPANLTSEENEGASGNVSTDAVDANKRETSNRSGQDDSKNKEIADDGKKLPMPTLPDDFDPMPPKVIPGKIRTKKPVVTNDPPIPPDRKVVNKNTTKTKAPVTKTTNTSKPIILPVVKNTLPVRFLYRDKTGVGKLWKFDKSQRDYIHVPPDSVMKKFEKFIVPESFETEFSSEAGVSITVSCSASFTLLPSDDHSLWGIDFKQGKLKIRRDSSLATNLDPSQTVSMAILIGGKLHYLQLLSPNSEFGIEIVPSLANGFQKSLGEDTFSGTIYSVAGKVKITDYEGGQWVLEAGAKRKDWLPLTPSVKKQFAKPGSAIPRLAVLPEWLTRDKTSPKARTDKLFPGGGIQKTKTKTELAALKVRDNAKFFRNEFEVDRTLTENLLAISRDRRSRIAALAVKSLTLTNNHKELIEILAKAQHKEARLEAYLGLRRWLPEDLQNSDLLKDGLKIYYSSRAVTPLVRLIWGIDRSNLKNPKDSEDILDWLNDSEPIVRELTFHQLSELTDLRFGYRPDSSVSQRSRSVARWKNHLKRQGALVVEKKKDAPPKKKKSKKQDSLKRK